VLTVTRDAVLAEVINLIRQSSKVIDETDAIGTDDELESLGIDSFSLVELIVSLESKFTIELPDEVLTPEMFQTAATVTEIVTALLDGGIRGRA
jgi:acyl carrier protein